MTAMVATRHILNLSAEWGMRPETAEALAERWLALFERLKSIDPVLARWTHWEEGRGLVAFDASIEAQISKVISGTTRTRDGQLFCGAGTYIWNTTFPCQRSRCFKVEMAAGRDYTSNQIRGTTDYDAVPDPALASYRVLRGALLAAAEIFDATQARVYPSDIRRLWTDPRGISEDLDLAWISYVAPRFAHLVTPPPAVVVEHRPNGGLLMAATGDTFSTDNRAHIKAAREIKAALAAYNAVPWTAETGK